MSKYRNLFPSPPFALTFFRSIFFILFATAIAYIVSQQATAPIAPSDVRAGKEEADDRSPSTARIVLVNADSLTVLSAVASSVRMTADQFQTAYAGKGMPRQGVDVANGASVQFVLPGASKQAQGVYSPDGKTRAQLIAPKADGTPVLQVTREQNQQKSVVLRLRDGRPLSQAVVYGWFGPTTMAVVAQATSTRWLYAVKIDGAMTPLQPLSDSVVHIEMRGTELWYVTATQGEGIESPPAGPSEVHRVQFDTVPSDTLVARDDRQAILSSTSLGPDQRSIAYTLDNGQAYLVSAQEMSALISLGTRRPLLFLPSGELLLRDGFALSLFDPKTQKYTVVGSVPEGAVHAFILPE